MTSITIWTNKGAGEWAINQAKNDFLRKAAEAGSEAEREKLIKLADNAAKMLGHESTKIQIGKTFFGSNTCFTDNSDENAAVAQAKLLAENRLKNDYFRSALSPVWHKNPTAQAYAASAKILNEAGVNVNNKEEVKKAISQVAPENYDYSSENTTRDEWLNKVSAKIVNHASAEQEEKTQDDTEQKSNLEAAGFAVWQENPSPEDHAKAAELLAKVKGPDGQPVTESKQRIKNALDGVIPQADAKYTGGPNQGQDMWVGQTPDEKQQNRDKWIDERADGIFAEAQKSKNAKQDEEKANYEVIADEAKSLAKDGKYAEAAALLQGVKNPKTNKEVLKSYRELEEIFGHDDNGKKLARGVFLAGTKRSPAPAASGTGKTELAKLDPESPEGKALIKRIKELYGDGKNPDKIAQALAVLMDPKHGSPGWAEDRLNVEKLFGKEMGLDLWTKAKNYSSGGVGPYGAPAGTPQWMIDATAQMQKNFELQARGVLGMAMQNPWTRMAMGSSVGTNGYAGLQMPAFGALQPTPSVPALNLNPGKTDYSDWSTK